MVIVETRVFTKRVVTLLTDDEYKDFQAFLVQYPGAGDVIPGTGGLRKVRWAVKGRGKRGGARAIYYRAVSKDTLLMLFIFAKNEQDDLSEDQKRILARIVREEYP
jgi:hypothetical protein